MLDLQDLSSNLLLVGFALISICCLYLLYSNFTKVREINELKIKVEDLKTIFLNQQKHNDDTYVKMMKMLQCNDITNEQVLSQNNLTPIAMATKVVNINPNLLSNVMLNTPIDSNRVNKSIILDLQDLDNLDELDSNIDDIDDIDNIDNIDNKYNENYNKNDNSNINDTEFFGVDTNIYDIKISFIKANNLFLLGFFFIKFEYK